MRRLSLAASSVRLSFHDPVADGYLYLGIGEPEAEGVYFRRARPPLLTIAWNRGPAQVVVVDDLPVPVPAGAFVALVVNQTFRFSHPGHVVLWQFDRDFYCIVDHDPEVSCAGLLFYGAHGVPVLPLSDAEQPRYGALLDVFVEEMGTRDAIQGEMLRMLLKRLIIKLTRIARAAAGPPTLAGPHLDIVRRFNLFVEQNYRTHHRVQDYAAMLNRSPKTLSNLFARFEQPTPLAIIRARLSLEARRLLRYTDRSAKQIAEQLGFADLATFGRFFKSEHGVGPAAFRRGRGDASMALRSHEAAAGAFAQGKSADIMG